MSDLDDTNNDDIVQYLVNQIHTNSLQYSKSPTEIPNDANELNSDDEQMEKNLSKNSGEDDNKKPRKRKSNVFYEVVIPSYTPDEFRYYFRMSRSCFASLMERLSTRMKIFNMEKKLLFSIWMLSTRESFYAVGNRFGLAKGASYQHFCEIIDGLIVLFKEYVSWPSQNDFSQIEQGFKPNIGGYIPGIVGAINNCHIQIKKPARYSIYCNQRQTHSIILQAVCDHQKIFTDVYVGAPGCLHTERVYLNSPLSKEIKSLIPTDFHIVGNIYYPPGENLVVPFVDDGNLSETQLHFNNCLDRASSTIEKAFRLLLSRFRRLAYLDTSKPELANKMVCCCIILHNHIIMTDVDEDINLGLQEETELFLNTDSEAVTASNDDFDGLIKRNNLLSLFEFI